MKRFVTWTVFALILGGYVYARYSGLIEDQMGKDTWLLHRRAGGCVGVAAYLIGVIVASPFKSNKR